MAKAIRPAKKAAKKKPGTTIKTDIQQHIAAGTGGIPIVRKKPTGEQ
jgi:hypothetical protein